MAHDLHKSGSPGGSPTPHDVAARHDPVYDDLNASAEFAELRRRYRAFVLPATVAFLSWFLLYVVMSNWANDFMGRQVVGNVNVALVFGLLQFVTTFLIAYLYSRYSSRRLDPLADQLHDEYEAQAAQKAAEKKKGAR